MADYSLNEWWQMRHSTVDNPLPALQLGASIVQHRAQQDLQERELGNQIARTSLMRDEMVYKQKIQTMLTAGNAEMAKAIAGVDDWTDDEQVSKVWEAGAQNPMTVGGKAWLGAQHMHESAVKAQNMALNTQSLIESRKARAAYNQDVLELKNLLADSTVDVNDNKVLDLQSRITNREQMFALRDKIDTGKLEIQRLLAEENVDYTDARIQKIERENAMAERRMLVSEGNLALRTQELGQKGRRLDMRSQAMYKNELTALNNEEKGLIKTEEAKPTPDPEEIARLRKVYNLRRRGITEKFYGPATTNAPVAAPSAPAASAPATPSGITKEEYDKLKPGEEYLAPDGSRRIKGG